MLFNKNVKILLKKQKLIKNFTILLRSVVKMVGEKIEKLGKASLKRKRRKKKRQIQNSQIDMYLKLLLNI